MVWHMVKYLSYVSSNKEESELNKMIKANEQNKQAQPDEADPAG